MSLLVAVIKASLAKANSSVFNSLSSTSNSFSASLITKFLVMPFKMLSLGVMSLSPIKTKKLLVDASKTTLFETYKISKIFLFSAVHLWL